MRLFLNEEEKEMLDRFPLMAKEISDERENSRKLGRDSADLYVLAVGCHRHPSYRAHRKPTSGCVVCARMLRAGDDLRSRGFSELRALKPGKKAKNS